MKKPLIISITIIVLVAGYFWYRKHKKEKEGENLNPSYDLNPVQKTKKRTTYKALTSPQVTAMAKEVMVKFPSNLVLPDVKVDLLNRLLLLQRESLVAVYQEHFKNYGKSRGKDMIWYLDNHTFLRRNARAKALRKALATLIPTRPAIAPAKPGYNLFLDVLLKPFKS